MSAARFLLAALTAQRLIELVHARRNTAALLERGAYERGAGHYPVMVGLHAMWLATLWLRSRDAALDRRFAAGFAVLQALRGWVLVTLGERWTTRIILLPGAAPIRHFS